MTRKEARTLLENLDAIEAATGLRNWVYSEAKERFECYRAGSTLSCRALASGIVRFEIDGAFFEYPEDAKDWQGGWDHFLFTLPNPWRSWLDEVLREEAAAREAEAAR